MRNCVLIAEGANNPAEIGVKPIIHRKRVRDVKSLSPVLFS